MPIRRITHDNGTLQVELLDDTGAAVPEVAAFLHHLAAREYSPNTLVAYAHDLQHLWRFLASSGLTWTQLQPPHALDLLAYLRTFPSVHLVQRLGLTLTTTTHDGQTPPRHPCHPWELKRTGSSREKSPLGSARFSL